VPLVPPPHLNPSHKQLKCGAAVDGTERETTAIQIAKALEVSHLALPLR